MVENKKTLVARLFADHGSSLQAFLYKRVRRRPDAVDLAQEVYVRMLRVPDMEAIRNPEGVPASQWRATAAWNITVTIAATVRRSMSRIR